MREIRTAGSEGGAAQSNASFLPLSLARPTLSACTQMGQMWQLGAGGLTFTVDRTRLAWMVPFSHFVFTATVMANLCVLLRAEDAVLVDTFLHVRNVDAREWSHFPEKPIANRLIQPFDLEQPQKWQLLTLRQSDIKQEWSVLVNGTKIGKLEQDHNDMQLALTIPPGVLRAISNTLEIRSASTEADDIRVGEIALHAESLSEFTKASSLSITVTDADTGAPLPCRITIALARNNTLALLGAKSDDHQAVRTGVIYSLDGKTQTGVPPGTYRVWAGRGFEYSLAETEIAIEAGDHRSIAFTLRREVPTPGLVACDPHLHTNEFAQHGDATLVERLITLAGEGIELPISTEHDQHIDYAKEAARIGVDAFFTPVVGCEVTTHEGHFNSFPIAAGAEPAMHRLRPWPQIFQNIYATPGVKIVILNHARDLHAGFRPFGAENFDASSGTFLNGRTLEANGIELINSGAQQTDPMQLVRDWLSLLNSGHRIAGFGSSDSHTVNFAIAGQARTYIPCPDHDPADLDVTEAVEAILAGETHTCFGLLTLLQQDNDGASLTAKVLGPEWTQARTLTLFANGKPIEKVSIPGDASKRAGLKFEQTWNLAELGIGSTTPTIFVAVADGPGITAPWWPIMPPYQPDSPDFKPYVMGISPAVRR